MIDGAQMGAVLFEANLVYEDYGHLTKVEKFSKQLQIFLWFWGLDIT